MFFHSRGTQDSDTGSCWRNLNASARAWLTATSIFSVLEAQALELEDLIFLILDCVGTRMFFSTPRWFVILKRRDEGHHQAFLHPDEPLMDSRASCMF